MPVALNVSLEDAKTNSLPHEKQHTVKELLVANLTSFQTLKPLANAVQTAKKYWLLQENTNLRWYRFKILTDPSEIILQFCAQFPGLWIKARLKLTLFWYKPHCFSYENHVVVMITNFYLHNNSSEGCMKTSSTPASLLFKSLVTEHRTVKWSIEKSLTV